MTADVGLHVYGNRKIRSQFKMKEADRKLTSPHDEAEKHLGVLFDRMLSYRQHIGSIVKKMNRMIGLLLLSCPSHNFPHLLAHAIASSVTVARSSAVQARLVDGMRGGGPPYVAPHSRNPPTERCRNSTISSSLFSHGPPLCAVG